MYIPLKNRIFWPVPAGEVLSSVDGNVASELLRVIRVRMLVLRCFFFTII